MRSIRWISLTVLAAAPIITACGGGSGGPDAAQITDARIDAPPPPPGCDYGELSDTTNDDQNTMTGQPEVTGLSFTTSTVLCGKINSAHFDANATAARVDADSYAVNIQSDSTILLSLTGGAGAAALDDLEVLASDDQGIISGGLFVTNHAITSVPLAAGNYIITMYADSAAAATADIDYKIKVVPDSPTRCAKATTAATYTEAHDTAGTANDMVDITYGQNGSMPVLTALGTDMPEPTAITTAQGMTYRISGSSADVNAADDYHDRDTYLFTTGPNTNQLSIRLNWPSTAVDFDWFLFPAGMVPEDVSSTAVGRAEDEFVTFATGPNKQYWLWVGSYDGDGTPADAPTLPAAYDLTICDENFVQ